MARFRLTEPAEADLAGLADFIARDSQRAAARVVANLEVAIRGLAEAPGKGHTRADLTDESDLRFWPVHAWLVVYRAGSAPLEVIRILDGRRNVAAELGPG